MHRADIHAQQRPAAEGILLGLLLDSQRFLGLLQQWSLFLLVKFVEKCVGCSHSLTLSQPGNEGPHHIGQEHQTLDQGRKGCAVDPGKDHAKSDGNEKLTDLTDDLNKLSPLGDLVRGRLRAEMEVG